jgi:hypothetical protein
LTFSGLIIPSEPGRIASFQGDAGVSVTLARFEREYGLKIIAFITEYAVVDRIIDHLKLTFSAEKPPPSHVFTEIALIAAEESVEYF